MLTPKGKVSKFYASLGIEIGDSYDRMQRARGAKKPLYCPFAECLRSFQETGNLKTHLRIHVSIIFRGNIIE